MVVIHQLSLISSLCMLKVMLSALWIAPALVHIVLCHWHYSNCQSHISTSSSSLHSSVPGLRLRCLIQVAVINMDQLKNVCLETPIFYVRCETLSVSQILQTVNSKSPSKNSVKRRMVVASVPLNN